MSYGTTNFTIKESIGEGHEGHVFTGTYNNENCAIKSFDDGSKWAHETKIMKNLKKCKNHKSHIVTFFDYKIIDGSKKTYYIIMEKGDCDLHTKLKDTFKDAHDIGNNDAYHREIEVVNISIQIARAIRFMHTNGYSHRDLKLENIIVFGNIYKICDFGFTIKKKLDDKKLGSPIYTAPELINPLSTSYNTKKIDIYSFGIMIYTMLHMHYPYEYDHDLHDINYLYMQKINGGPEILELFSNDIKNLILSMISVNSKKRPKINIIIKKLKKIEKKLK